MTGVQRIVDDVRSLIAARDQTLTDRLRDLATEYAQACDDAESRLRRCEELTRSGHYGEALYLAELDPPLLNVMSSLSFPERRQWGDLTSMYGLPEPKQLSVSRAKELNKVYADFATAAPNVVRLRHLNRTRAPLAERATVLRTLCKQDPNSAVWPEQLSALEVDLRADLLKQMDTDLKAGDRARMFEYYSALTAPGWRKPAPPPMIARAALECLPAVIGRLSLAIGKTDLTAARQIRKEWDRIARDALLTPDHPLADRGAILCERLDELDRRGERDQQRRDTIETLREALHRGATADELTTAYDRAQEAEAKVPKSLLDQYQAQMTKYENRRDNRQAILGIVAIVLGAIVLIVFLVQVMRR